MARLLVEMAVMDTYFCPSCSYQLVSQIRAGVLSWFCPHCYQEMPYGIGDRAMATVRRSRIGRVAGTTISAAVIEPPRSMGLKTSLEFERIVDIFYRYSNRSFDLGVVLERITSGLRKILAVDRALVCRLEVGKETAIVTESIAPGRQSAKAVCSAYFPSDRELAELKQGKIHTIQQPCDSNSPETSTLDCLLEVSAKLVVPILINPPPSKKNKIAASPLQLWGVLILHQCYQPRHWKPAEMEFASLMSEQIADSVCQDRLYRELEAANEQLQRLACLDELTQLSNRRYFQQFLQQEWSRSTRQQQPLSLVFCDIDGFKQFNDRWGHSRGDRCLQQVAAAIQSAAKRGSDVVARWGGDEFVIILSDTDEAGAMQVAKNICDRVKALKIERSADDRAYITISCGVATIVPQATVEPETLVRSADLGLFAAKSLGRDRVEVSREAIDPSN